MRVAGCQEACLADSERDTGVCTEILMAINITHCKSLGHRTEIWMALIHRNFANSITLAGLSNYRASTTADTLNLIDLVRVAQQGTL